MLHASQLAPGAIGVIRGSALDSSPSESDLLGWAGLIDVEDDAGREGPRSDIVYDLWGKVKGRVRARGDGRDGHNFSAVVGGFVAHSQEVRIFQPHTSSITACEMAHVGEGS